MSRTALSIASRLFSRARLLPIANRHSRTTKLRLDSLEAKEMPGDIKDPLVAMAYTFGCEAMRAEGSCQICVPKIGWIG